LGLCARQVLGQNTEPNQKRTKHAPARQERVDTGNFQGGFFVDMVLFGRGAPIFNALSIF
jgi:hypothetical protein